MSKQDNNDRNWELNVNLSGLQAPTGGTNVEQGYYKARISDMYVRPEKPGRVVIKLTISEGACAGSVRTTGLNLPKSNDDKVRYYWRGLSESVGYTPTELDSGEVSLGVASFQDRTAHFFYTPKELSSDGYDSVDFLPPAEWSARSATFVGSASGAPASPIAAATSGGNTTSADSVRAKLGL